MKLSQKMFCVLVLLCTSAVGCSGLIPELDSFGSLSSPNQYRSLNGLGAYREMWESTGARCYTPTRLSPKLDDFSTIILIGKTYAPPGKVARDWLENWLAQAPGRTVIYFGRDFDASIYYRQATLDQIGEEDREQAEILLAREEAKAFNSRVSQFSESAFCDWFYVDTESGSVENSELAGLWAPDQTPDRNNWQVGLTLRPPAIEQQRLVPSWIKKQAKGGATGGTNLNSPVRSDDPNVIQRSVWESGEINSKEAWDESFEQLLEPEVLLAGNDDFPLIYRLRDSERFPDSQIIILQNGAPLLNGTIVQPFFREIAASTIESCLPADRVAFLSYGLDGLVISNIPETDGRGAGLEMLTVWPLSALTMTAALFGIIVCAVLLPIVGRPQSLPRSSVSDFGLHVDALGQMLSETRDVGFAQKAIRDYFQKVRGDPPPTWLDDLGKESGTPVEVQQPPVVKSEGSSEEVDPSSRDQPSAGSGASDASPQK